MNIFFQVVKLLVIVLPAIVPIIASYLQYRKGNQFWFFWLIGGLVMATSLALTIKFYGFEKLQDL